MISRKLLRRLTPAVIKEALQRRTIYAKLEKLSARRRSLMSEVGSIDMDMAILNRQLMQKPGPKPKREKRGRWKRSAATRRKMAASQKARWAKKRKAEKAVGIVKRGNTIQEAAKAGS